MRFRLHIALLFVLFISCVATAQEPERILSYDSDVTVNDDGSMLVKESIRVHVAGQKIVHGIYRDFPTEYKDKMGIRKRVPFDIASVRRDGQDEPYHTGTRENGIRVYIGPRFADAPLGDHTYEITYRTDRQIGFYEDRDELYWNVTGNGWDFPIEHASARVMLPTGIPRKRVETYGYTGPQGYTGRDFSAQLMGDSSYFFETTKPLDVHEGMTIVCWWDKGFMQPPSDAQKRQWFMDDNEGILLAVGGLALVLIYQIVTWSMVGKDPAPGTIVTSYMPPEELSAAAVRELVKMKFDNKAFAACIVSMAAKKYLTINKDALDTFTLLKNDDPKLFNALSAEEKLVATRLFARGSSVLLSTVNRDVITEATKALKQSLATRMEKVYFVRNSGYLAPSIALSVLTLVIAVWNADSQMKPMALFMMVWLSGWSLGVAALSATVINLWKAALKGGPGGAVKGGGALFMTLFALPFVAGEGFGIFMLTHATSVITVFVLGALIASNFVYHELLKAPTHMGRELLDKVEGFKQFLSATEGDQIKRMPVNWNVDTFNRFLSYAIALDVEEAWASKFSQAVSAASAAASAGSSISYSGAMAGAIISGGFAGSLGDSLSGATSSASAAPGSSSGSGGGGSSGGGGGGGGGGW
ncbi:MAG: DUF2207 domain-containing protein [Terriglobales bacterium]